MSKGLTIHGIASVTDTKLDGLVWYRREQLVASGIAVEIIDFNNQTALERKILPFLSDEIPLVYIPSLDKISVNNNKRIKEFGSFLEVIRNLSTCTKVLLLSDNTGYSTIQKTYLKSFELVLSSYHSMYGVPTVVLQVGGVYGPWSEQGLLFHEQMKKNSELNLQLEVCWYISDAVEVIYKVIIRNSKGDYEFLDLGGCQQQIVHFSPTNLNQVPSVPKYTSPPNAVESWDKLVVDKKQLHTLRIGISKTLSWARAFESLSFTTKKNVIFTSYFTSENDPQRGKPKRPNQFSYLKDWYNSVVRLNMRAIVFHDGLNPQFQHKLTQHYSGISFVHVPSLNDRSTNDARFYSYLNYLEQHPEIHSVILTDISDVQFQKDPFELMDLLGKWLYVGTDIDIFPTMHTMPWIHERLNNCFSHSPQLMEEIMDMDTVYNAGVIGGSRELMLSALTRIVGYLDISPPELNCNMPAVNAALHRHFFDDIFTGYPLTSRFLRRQETPKGVYILHK